MKQLLDKLTELEGTQGEKKDAMKEFKNNDKFEFNSEQSLEEISKIISDRMLEIFIKSGEKNNTETAK